VVFTITNGFNFDPIRPQAGSDTTNTGNMTLTVNNGSAGTLGNLIILGTTSAITANATSTFTLPLSGTITGSQPLTVTMTLTSPLGSNVVINTSQVISISAVPTINIASATVSIGAQAVNAPADTVDMSKIDSTIIKRIKDTSATQGTMFLTITNPFTIGGAMNVSFSSPAGVPAIVTITKAVTLTAAANGTTPNVSTVTVNFTGTELRTLLGHKLLVAFGGNTAAGSLTVTPSQKVSVSSRLQLTFFAKAQ
jgi:hypothetical protein